MLNDDRVGQAVHEAIDEYMTEKRTAIPVRVTKFDADNNTVDVKVLIKEFIGDKPEEIDTLKEVPILLYGNKEVFITFPIKEGDDGIVIIADRSIDEHLEEFGEVRDNRHMDISDAMFIPMYLRPKSERVKKWDKDSIVIRNKIDDEMAMIFNPKEKTISTRFVKDKITTRFKKDSIELMTNDEKTKFEITKESVKTSINDDLKLEIKDSEIIVHEKITFKKKVTVDTELEANGKVDLNGAVKINGITQIGS